MNNEIIIPTESAMETLGGLIAKQCPQGVIIYLQGDLGAGKTTFTRGFLRALGYTGAVKSPTYTLVEPYELNDKKIYHFDLYRLTDPEELELIGIRDYTGTDSICLIEWPERAKSCLPVADLICMIAHQQQQRKIQLLAKSDIGRTILRQMHDKDL